MSAYRLFPCPSCNRHVQPAESSCPFCKHPLVEKVSPAEPKLIIAPIADFREMRLMYGSPAVMQRAMIEEERRARAAEERRQVFVQDVKPFSIPAKKRCGFLRVGLPLLFTATFLGLAGYLLFY